VKGDIIMNDKIKYYFNIGDKLRIIDGGGFYADILNGAVGYIINETSSRKKMINVTKEFALRIIEPESLKGQIWILDKSEKFELLGTLTPIDVNLENNEKYKIIIKDEFIITEKKNDYIEFKNGSKIECIGGINENISLISKRGNEWFKNNVVTVEPVREVYVCVKNCIYKVGSKVEIMRRVNDFIIVTDGNSINPFRESEFEECFTECIDINKVEFKMVDTKQIKVIKEC
jgi:hypothetical protein